MAKEKKRNQIAASPDRAGLQLVIRTRVQAGDSGDQGKNQLKKIVKDWNEYFGPGDLEDWRRLMRDLGFKKEFPSKRQCRNALKGVWVNIRDFLDAVKDGDKIHFFPSQSKLAEYTRADKSKIYPRKYIKKGSPLRDLLAHIFGTPGA